MVAPGAVEMGLPSSVGSRTGARARRPWQTEAAFIAMAFGALGRCWAAIEDHGMLWPDEIYQTLEQAHRMAFHFGLIPWEFRSGARSWVMPGLIGLYWEALSKLGVHHSFGLVVGAKLLMAAVSVVGIEVGRRLAQRLGGPTAGLMAALLLSACPLLLYFGSRVMTETASGTVLLAAVYLALVSEEPHPASAGALAALAIFFRYQNGLLAICVLAVLAWWRNWRAALRYAAAATAVGIAGGMLDWATWSYPFQSFWIYLDYNLLSGAATQQFGAIPVSFYLQHLESSIGATLGLIVFGAAVAGRKSPALLGLVLIYLLAHFAIPHKELRFLLPIIPLAVTLGAVGLCTVCEHLVPGPAWATGLGLVMALAMALRSASPMLEDVGRLGDTPLWHDGEAYNRGEWVAEAREDLCGIALVGYDHEWVGGYTYLHRPVPIYFDTGHLANINYVLGGKDEKLPTGWHRVEDIDEFSLYRRDGTCAPNPDYIPNLN